VKADATVGVIRVPIEETHRFGTVVTDAKGRIQEFVEKSSNPLSNLASMGIYVFNKDILAKRLVEDASKSDSLHDFGYAILPKMAKCDRVFAYEFNGYWQDIGTVEAYYEANMELLVSRPRFSLDSNWPVFSENSDLPVPTESEDGNIVPMNCTSSEVARTVKQSRTGRRRSGRFGNMKLKPRIKWKAKALLDMITENDGLLRHQVHLT
jgi:glucose-1-phosphate adenylyltransferase